MATVWEVITALAPFLAVLVSIAVGLLIRVVWNHEKRIKSNEKDITRYGRTLYGDDDDPTQEGISRGLQNLREQHEEESNE